MSHIDEVIDSVPTKIQSRERGRLIGAIAAIDGQNGHGMTPAQGLQAHHGTRISMQELIPVTRS